VTTAPATYGPSAPDPSFLDSLPALGPPKKRHTWVIFLIITLAFILVGIAGWVAVVLGNGRALNGGIIGASTEASQSHQAEDDKSAPRKVKPGEAFTVGSHKTLSGWKVKQDTSIGGAHFNVTGKVKNGGDDTSTAFIHFKFIDSSGEVLGTVQCNSADIKPGQTQALNCIPDGKYGNYKRVTAEAAS
jgi:hypothetical protein